MTNFIKPDLTKIKSLLHKEVINIFNVVKLVIIEYMMQQIWSKKCLNKLKIVKYQQELVPKCPVCGENMDVNLRKDAYFVQDDNWYKQDKRYEEFIDNAKDKKVVLLELGVGFNTPGIIRIPFEQMTFQNTNWSLVRINKGECTPFLDIKDRFISFENDINKIVELLVKK